MVNLDAARRQALGVHFTTAEDEAERLAHLKAGRLVMAPHKAWNLPDEPTWQEDPFQDNNWQFQYHMLRWLDPLRRAGAEGDEDAARLWEFWARSWIEANPPGAGQSKWSWIDMSDGIRAMELCHGLTVVGEQDWLITSLHDHVAWLTEPSHLKRGNHGFHQHVGLFVLGVVLEDPAVTELALERLTAQLAAAYDEQGANEEGSVSYHLQNYVWWNDALQRLDLEGIPRPELSRRLELAPRLLAHATSPLGRFARIGDTDGGNPRKVDHPLTRFVVTAGKEGTKPDSTTAIYDAGYAFLRSGWGEERPYREETFVTATWGRQDKVHGHRDGGSVTYASNGVQWIDDTGKYYYGKSPMRTYVLGREGHNAIVIPGRKYRKDTEVVLLGHEETDDYVDLALHDRGYDDVSIVRRILFLKARHLLLVLDDVESTEPLEVEQRWHAGAGITALRIPEGIRLFHGRLTTDIALLGAEAQISAARGVTSPVLGWMSTGWRRRVATESVSLRRQGTRVQFVTLLGSDPTAAELLMQAGITDKAVGDSLASLLPDELLTSPKQDPRTRSAQATSLSGEAWSDGARVVTVSASGPGEFFAFSLLPGRGEATIPVYKRRNFASFLVEDALSCRVKIYNRDRGGAITTRVVPVLTSPSSPAVPLEDNRTVSAGTRIEVRKGQAQ